MINECIQFLKSGFNFVLETTKMEMKNTAITIKNKFEMNFF